MHVACLVSIETNDRSQTLVFHQVAVPCGGLYQNSFSIYKVAVLLDVKLILFIFCESLTECEQSKVNADTYGRVAALRLSQKMSMPSALHGSSARRDMYV